MSDRYSKYVHIGRLLLPPIILPITSRIFIAMTDGPVCDFLFLWPPVYNHSLWTCTPDPNFVITRHFVSFYWGHAHKRIPHELWTPNPWVIRGPVGRLWDTELNPWHHVSWTNTIGWPHHKYRTVGTRLSPVVSSHTIIICHRSSLLTCPLLPCHRRTH